MSLPGNQHKNWRKLCSWILIGILLLVVAYYVVPLLLNDSSTPIHLVIYAFSTQEEAFTQGILPAFEKTWEEENHEDLIIETVFGPSGTLAGQINLGAPADLAIFSNQRQIDWLKLGKLVNKGTESVVIATTPLVIISRPGNPLEIASFTDLARPGIRLLHADPRCSGVGEWAILAEYGSAYLETGDRSTAESQLQEIWHNVKWLAPSARAAMTLFEYGVGDATITYEQDALLAQVRGIPIEIIQPESTILARHHAVIVDDNITSRERKAAEALLAFILSTEGQQILNQYHIRSADITSTAFPPLGRIFTEEDLGGWSQAYEDLIENLWKTEIEGKLELESVTPFLEAGK
jgi:ABC-type sulfate transport system substrate-binding protein